MFSTGYTHKSILPWFLYGYPLSSSFLASRDQINLRDLWGLPAGPSGQSDSSGCSGETNQLICDLWAVSTADSLSVWPAAGELQQLCGTRRLHVISRHLRNVTCHLHNGRSSAGTSEQMSLTKWVLIYDPRISSPPHRSSPWDYFAPSPCSTWGVLTASCGAAWFRGRGRKQPTSGNSSKPRCLHHLVPLLFLSTLVQPLSSYTTIGEGEGGESLSAFLMSSKLWQMFTVRLSANVKPPDFPSGVGVPLKTFQCILMCPPASLWGGSLTLRHEGSLNIPQPGFKVVLLWKFVTFKKFNTRPVQLVQQIMAESHCSAVSYCSIPLYMFWEFCFIRHPLNTRVFAGKASVWLNNFNVRTRSGEWAVCMLLATWGHMTIFSVTFF